MASALKTQDAWHGEFGDRYTQRNAVTADAVRGRARVWGEVLPRLAGDPPRSILEVGPNVGLNLRGLQSVSDAELWGIEPNGAARKQLLDDGILPPERLFEGFGNKIPLGDGAVDMAFTSGVLIHVDPSQLEETMREIHRVSARYIFCAEYFSPKAETIMYRGEQDLLFKNDFGSLYLDLFEDLALVDYGFFWKRTTVMDDTTWWLFRKV